MRVGVGRSEGGDIYPPPNLNSDIWLLSKVIWSNTWLCPRSAEPQTPNICFPSISWYLFVLSVFLQQIFDEISIPGICLHCLQTATTHIMFWALNSFSMNTGGCLPGTKFTVLPWLHLNYVTINRHHIQACHHKHAYWCVGNRDYQDVPLYRLVFKFALWNSE